jgi:hypothetical protein
MRFILVFCHEGYFLHAPSPSITAQTLVGQSILWYSTAPSCPELANCSPVRTVQYSTVFGCTVLRTVLYIRVLTPYIFFVHLYPKADRSSLVVDKQLFRPQPRYYPPYVQYSNLQGQLTNLPTYQLTNSPTHQLTCQLTCLLGLTITITITVSPPSSHLQPPSCAISRIISRLLSIGPIPMAVMAQSSPTLQQQQHQRLHDQ